MFVMNSLGPDVLPTLIGAVSTVRDGDRVFADGACRGLLGFHRDGSRLEEPNTTAPSAVLIAEALKGLESALKANKRKKLPISAMFTTVLRKEAIAACPGTAGRGDGIQIVKASSVRKKTRRKQTGRGKKTPLTASARMRKFGVYRQQPNIHSLKIVRDNKLPKSWSRGQA